MKFCNPDILCRWFVKYYTLAVIITPYLPAVITRKLPLDFLNCIIPIIVEFHKEGETTSVNLLLTSTISECHKRCRSLVTNIGMISGPRNNLKQRYYARC